jgi:hypothetical protein
MGREDIIRMAREAGLDPDLWNYTDAFERFAALVAAAEREKVAAWMMERGYATGHGNTIEELLKELEWQIREREREACAKVCDNRITNEAGMQREDYENRQCAAAIRARGNT